MDNRTTLEVIAPTIEEAIAKGASELGLPEDDLEVEILDSGSKGLFGLGSRQARVRLAVKSAADRREPAAQEIETTDATQHQTGYEAAAEDDAEEIELGQAEAPATPPRTMGQTEENITLHVARETVEELLEKMQVKATVVVYLGEPDDARSKTPVCVDINGKDLSILIGRQAETLNALQYIASLIVSKELGHSLPLVIDVEGYRKRRQQQIRYLARRMAEQAVKTGKRQILEPMPANERRIVHIELRENPDVTTESVGEEPRRKVTIIPRS
jgi:spoIIIJ-associated protein